MNKKQLNKTKFWILFNLNFKNFNQDIRIFYIKKFKFFKCRNNFLKCIKFKEKNQAKWHPKWSIYIHSNRIRTTIGNNSVHRKANSKEEKNKLKSIES